MKTAVFTIASKNYFAYVRTIMQSLEKSNPHMDRFAVVVDDLDDEFVALPRNFELLPLDDLDLPHPECFKFRYDIMEFNTAVKPFAILKLFEKYDRVIYMDPDIYVYKQLKPVEDALDTGSNFVLTPHFNALFDEDGLHPDEPDIMRAGIYNLGFIALNKCADTVSMASWWADKLEKQCVNKQEIGIFVDQKWIDLVPGFYENVCILHDSGLNVAYWNLSHRTVKKEGSEYFVNGDPLIFFHFSGFNPNINEISKHQNRYKLSDIGDGADLFKAYAKDVLSNEFDMWKKFKYSFNNYTDGRPVLREHRLKYREDEQLQGYCGENPFEYGDIFYGDKEMTFEKNGVNLVGYLRSEHGVGEGVRLTANCLNAADVNWCGYDYEFGNYSRKNDLTFKNQIKQYFKYDTSIINVNADQFDNLYNHTDKALWDTYRIGVWYWELPEFPEQWTKAFLDVDEIWAPTQFIADCLKKCAPCPVYHMPPGIHHKEVDTKVYTRAYFGLPENTFLFLNMFDILSIAGRKNPFAVVESFKKAFAQDDMSVGMVLKINNIRYSEDIQEKIDNIIGDYKNIYILSATLERDAVNGLINTCDAAISMHRSEGLGLLCEEAMFFGKPVIATGWSGNMDFMTKETSCVVDYKLCPVGKDLGPYEAWQQWADPDVDEAAAYMKKLVTDKAYYEAVSKAAKEHIRNEFSPAVCGARMKARLEEIGKERRSASADDSKQKLRGLARVYVSCYQKACETRLDAAKKQLLAESWVNGNEIDFIAIAKALDTSAALKDKDGHNFAKALYEIILGRTPTADELAFRPVKYDESTRLAEILSFIKSGEFLGRNAYICNGVNIVSVDELAAARAVYTTPYYYDLNCGGIAALFKRLIRKLNKFLIVPIITRQQEYNAHVVQCLGQMQAQNAELNSKLERMEKLLTQHSESSNDKD